MKNVTAFRNDFEDLLTLVITNAFEILASSLIYQVKWTLGEF